MRTTTRRIVTLATCGAAFALPVIAGGTAQAETSGAGILNRGAAAIIVTGSDNGTAATLAKGGNSGSTATGYAYGAASGPAKTILLAKLSPAKPHNSSNVYNYPWGAVVTESRAGTNATGSVVALTKIGTTTIVSKYQAVANCEKWESSAQWSGDTYAASSDLCTLSSTSGTYQAKGGAVAAGLPQTGSTLLESVGYTRTSSLNGVVQHSDSQNGSCQTFNNRHCFYLEG
ncbi:MAG: hypothetical protein JWN87_2349 [Frankiales bacterium]|nr:hypothetical protein [Frankiales bacterium]